MRSLLIFVMVIVIALGVLYLVRSRYIMVTPPTAQTSIPTSTSITPSVTGKVDDFTVTAQNFSFSPSTITVNQGDLVRINFKVMPGSSHSFVIDSLDVNIGPIGPNQSQTTQFVASQKGTFQYYCNVGSHKDLGMIGSLIVQ